MLRFLTVLLDFSPRIILVTLEIIKKRVSSLLSFSLSVSLSRDRLLFLSRFFYTFFLRFSSLLEENNKLVQRV